MGEGKGPTTTSFPLEMQQPVSSGGVSPELAPNRQIDGGQGFILSSGHFGERRLTTLGHIRASSAGKLRSSLAPLD